jgi:hypothetical protein
MVVARPWGYANLETPRGPLQLITTRRHSGFIVRWSTNQAVRSDLTFAAS